MPLSARYGDMWSGICCCHSHPDCVEMSGIIITCSTNDLSSNRGQARIGDITIGWCGHTGVIVSGSSTAGADTMKKARIGDQVVGCNIGIIITGNPLHEIGG